MRTNSTKNPFFFELFVELKIYNLRWLGWNTTKQNYHAIYHRSKRIWQIDRKTVITAVFFSSILFSTCLSKWNRIYDLLVLQSTLPPYVVEAVLRRGRTTNEQIRALERRGNSQPAEDGRAGGGRLPAVNFFIWSNFPSLNAPDWLAAPRSGSSSFMQRIERQTHRTTAWEH